MASQTLPKVLPLPATARKQEAFETYKHCPEMLGKVDHFALPGVPPANKAYSTVGSQRVPSALEAEARARAISGVVLPLFGGAVAAVAHSTGVAVVELLQGGTLAHVDCKVPVLALARVAGSPAAEGGAEEESVLASGSGGQLAIVAISRTQASQKITARVAAAARLPPRDGEHEVDDIDLYVTAALAGERGQVLAIAHHVTGKRELEVIAVHLEGAACTRLATLRGSRLPSASCWCGTACAVLAAEGGFACVSPCGEPSAASTSGLVPMLTALHLGTNSSAPRVSSWAFSDGELLAAWPVDGRGSSEGRPVADTESCPAEQGTVSRSSNNASSSLALALGVGHDLLVMDLMLPQTPDSEPVLIGSMKVPGLAACASARSGLRLVLASPMRTFFALVETHGKNAVGVFRHPACAARAPTVAPQLDGLMGDAQEDINANEVRGAFLLENALVVLLGHKLVRYALDASVELPDAPRPLASRADLPLGVDPEALLRMLDMHGEE